MASFDSRQKVARTVERCQTPLCKALVALIPIKKQLTTKERPEPGSVRRIGAGNVKLHNLLCRRSGECWFMACMLTRERRTKGQGR